jgi:hypothetical protein
MVNLKRSPANEHLIYPSAAWLVLIKKRGKGGEAWFGGV